MLTCKPSFKSLLSIIQDLSLDGVPADEFAARFFTAIARRVSPEVSEDLESYKAGVQINLVEFSALSPKALDCLANTYLEKTEAGNACAIDKGNESSSPSSGTQKQHDHKVEEFHSAERPTERLLRTVREASNQYSSLREGIGRSSNELEKIRNGLEFPGQQLRKMLGALAPGDQARKILNVSRGPTDQLMKSLEHTSLLASNLDRTLSKIRTPDLSNKLASPTLEATTRDVLPNLKLIENPARETNRRLVELTDAVAQLVRVAQQQAELSQAIRDSSDVALHYAIRSREEATAATLLARKGVRLTFWAIVVAILTAGLSMGINLYLSAGMDNRVQQEIHILHEISDELRPSADSTVKPKSQTAPTEKQNRANTSLVPVQ
jgi:hypothetical protein